MHLGAVRQRVGSRGSVLPLFREQIALCGPVTVTDPDVIRYFKTIPEACELVEQAGAIGADGEVMVLDMGEQVRIVELAERLIAESGSRWRSSTRACVPANLAEELFGPGEVADPSDHPLISRVSVPPISESTLVAAREGQSIHVDLRLALPDGATINSRRTGPVTA